jgi:two-component system, sensor histidine kinase PhcS
MSLDLKHNPQALQAYEDYERKTNLRHLSTGCWLVMILMPAGSLLDYFVYPEKTKFFLVLRLACAVCGGLVWLALRSPLRERFDRVLCLAVGLTPAFFMSWMIYATNGAASTYYAGLNLVLLSVSFIVRWSVDLSLAISLSIVGMYLGACFLSGSGRNVPSGLWVNNLYFLLVTSAFVVISGWMHRSLRVREFLLNYQLDQNKRELESTNTKLADQNDALARANREIREAEAQLVQSERMATLGRLSVSLLHDIRNPLTFAKQALFNLQSKPQSELSPVVQKQLGAIERGIERVEGIITPLYSFSHSAGDAPEMVDLAEVLTTANIFVSYELKDKNIAYEQHITPGQTVFANRNQFISVVINLIENAAHALEQKKFPEGESPAIRVTGWVDERRSFVAIRDNGPGIEPGQRARLFRAFATTKKPGEGLGLGLNICYNNIQKSGGDLSVNTEVGKFCEFVINLPVDAAAAATAANAPAK